MKNNPLIYSNLMRKGIKNITMSSNINNYIFLGEIGDWKNYFKKEQKDHVLRKFKEKIEPFGINVTFE
jgi:hypothetical protein